MKTPIRTLPIVDAFPAEKWDCQGCGNCCRGTTILLDRQDVEKLRQQRWETQPEFQNVKTVVRSHLLGGQAVLATKSDGSCVFLSDSGRCRIHEQHGADAKPAVCRMYPFQLVPLQRHTNLTLRFGCPSAAAGEGRPLGEHLKKLSRSRLTEKFATPSAKPPRITSRVQRSWKDFELVADTLERITTDGNLPLVRRVVHGLRFCDLLADCDLRTITDQDFAELPAILEALAPDEVGKLFRDRQPPNRATGFLFRQAASHFIRSHPRYPEPKSLSKRLSLVWATTRLARGRGRFPNLHPDFKPTTFEQLEVPLGPLDAEVMAPLERYFVSNVRSRQYAVQQDRRSLLESYRDLVLAFPMSLWLLRLVKANEVPTKEDMIDVVTTIDRAKGTKAIARSATLMATSGGLEQLVAWYAR